MATSDEDILQRINALVEEEHSLEREGDPTQPVDLERLRAVEVALDQCWDLLRQRRARRAAGQDEDDADVRSPATVETYLQ